MVYSTSKCPKCGKVVKKQTNPVHVIGNPFERCHWCGSVYLDSYKEEWITKSPWDRFFFFLQSGVWARAFIMPVLLLLVPIALFDINEDVLFTLWPFLSIAWLVVGYFVHKSENQRAISESLKRTHNVEYLNLLIKAGYTIYPIYDSKQSDNSTLATTTNAGKKETTSTNEGVTHICLSDPNDIPKRKSGMTYGSDLALQPNATTTNVKKASYCRKCGNKLLADSKFCSNCGTKIIIEDANFSPRHVSCIQEPQNAEILSGVQYKKCSQITIRASRHQSYVVKLKNIFGEEKLSFYVRAGKTVTIGVPNEDMYVFFASGDSWYGMEHLFGANTRYTKDAQIKNFAESGWKYDLSPSNDGGFQPIAITPEEFK